VSQSVKSTVTVQAVTESRATAVHVTQLQLLRGVAFIQDASSYLYKVEYLVTLVNSFPCTMES
jgi:hypothetical protein